MISMREFGVFSLVVLVCTLSGCYTVPMRTEKDEGRRGNDRAYPFVLEITNYYYPGAASLSYYLTYDRVVVTGTNPYAGPGTTELFSSHLDLEERNRWTDFISAFPVQDLDAEYVDPNVLDGFYRLFHFRVGWEERRISVSNTHVEPLSRLCEEVNRLVPPEMAVGTMHPSVAERLRELQAFD